LANIAAFFNAHGRSRQSLRAIRQLTIVRNPMSRVELLNRAFSLEGILRLPVDLDAVVDDAIERPTSSPSASTWPQATRRGCQLWVAMVTSHR
jgi:hypothetical protein